MQVVTEPSIAEMNPYPDNSTLYFEFKDMFVTKDPRHCSPVNITSPEICPAADTRKIKREITFA